METDTVPAKRESRKQGVDSVLKLSRAARRGELEEKGTAL